MPDDEVRPGPRLSVVVCTRDRPAILAETLAALKKELRPDDELLVVDSASRDPAVRRVGAAAGADVIRLDAPGASRARNAGFAAARAPVVAFVDDDCAVAEGWAEAVVRSFARDETLGFVTGAVTADRAAGVPLSLVAETEQRRFALGADPFSLGSGGNMAVRRSALEAIGGWDERLGPATRLRAAEDVDVLWRILHAGWTGAYEPSIVVVHHQWQSRRQAVGRFLGYGIGAGGFIGKVLRIDRAAGRRLRRARLGHDGVGQAWRLLRSGWMSGAAAELAAVAGVLIGLERVRGLGLRGTLFSARRG